MGQFKPMVKMETTEPSVELKLKKGGHVAMKKGGHAEAGHKKMAGGGALEMLSGTPALIGRPAVNASVRAPGKPSMAARRSAMMARKPAMSEAPMPPMPPMKKGGKAEGYDMTQDKAMIKKAFKQHDEQEHESDKGTSLKLKKGGMNKLAAGGVTMSNAGGFKAGGKSSKKAFAAGGTVNSGKPVAMPQGAKKPSSPVSIDRLSGTFKRGGTVKMASGGAGSVSDKEGDMSKGAYDAHYALEKADNKAGSKIVRDALMFLPRQAKKAFNSLTGQGDVNDKERSMLSLPKSSVTNTEKSITVVPSKKRGGRAC